jgi:hypothetical protein
MLLHSPDYLFLLPGLLLMLLGLVGMAALLPGPIAIGQRLIDVHAMVLAALLTTLGAQVVMTGLSAKAYAFTHHFVPSDRLIESFYRRFSLERGLLLSLGVFGLGFLVDLQVLVGWLLSGFGELSAIRPALFGSTLMALGAQAAFGSWLLAMLDIKEEARRRARTAAADRRAEPVEAAVQAAPAGA